MAEEKSGVKSQSLLSGAFILVVATILVKVIGALFKIPLSMLIGEVGRGYFSTAYEIYTPLYSISMAGLPVAVSRLVAKERSLGHFRDVRMIRRVSARLFLMMGILGTVLLMLVPILIQSSLSSMSRMFIACLRLHRRFSSAAVCQPTEAITRACRICSRQRFPKS